MGPPVWIETTDRADFRSVMTRSLFANRNDAFFLDFDGTLVDPAPTPDSVVVDPRVPKTLRLLYEATGGAVMIVTGRPLSEIDKLLALDLPAAGRHGAEIRLPGESHSDIRIEDSAFAGIAAACGALGANFPGIRYEFKNPVIAIHFPADDPLFAKLRDGAAKLVETTSEKLEFVIARNAIELRPPGVHKGRAVRAAAATHPFLGRRPVFIGDDTPDEDGFSAAHDLGGIGVCVGVQRPGAAHLLNSPDDVLAALAAIAEAK